MVDNFIRIVPDNNLAQINFIHKCCLVTLCTLFVVYCQGVAPFPGATTGTGGRIRDIQATGRGAHVIAGTAGYSFGNLHIQSDLSAHLCFTYYGGKYVQLCLLSMNFVIFYSVESFFKIRLK